jgi:hypothetical protein
MGSHDEDDDDEPCYRHPAERTALRCITCDRPICVRCAIAAPVGFKCPDHGRPSRAERAVVPIPRLAAGVAAAVATAVVAGIVLAVVRIQFFGIILAWLAGMLVGTVARRASGGYRDPLLARLAATAAGLGIAAPAGTALLAGATPGQWVAWSLLAAAAAAWGAYTRAS